MLEIFKGVLITVAVVTVSIFMLGTVNKCGSKSYSFYDIPGVKKSVYAVYDIGEKFGNVIKNFTKSDSPESKQSTN